MRNLLPVMRTVGSLKASWKLPEYPEYPVSLGEQSAVHHREAQPHSEPLEGAAGHAGLGEEEEGVEEAEEDPSEEDVAQLPPCHYAVLVIGNLYL